MQYDRLTSETKLAELLKSLDKRIKSVETKGTGTISWTDDAGVETIIGELPDGTTGFQPFVGDTTPPPVATAPEASSGVGAITIAWDGLFVNGEAQPADFQHLKVLGHKVVSGTITLTVEVGMIREPLDVVYVNSDVAAVNETWKFSFASVDYNGNTSAESAYSATVTQTSYKTDVEIASAISSLSSGVTGAQASADGKSTNYYEPTAPTNVPAGKLKKGDTWYDTANSYRVSTWTGSAWQTTQDSALAQLTAESKGRTYTQNVAPPVEARSDKNLWIDTSAGVGLYVTKYWDSTANSGSGAWVALKDKDAKAAQDTADAKGETIYDSAEPAAAKRLPQNTWIDTSGGLNIQKRWDGNAWVVVVDSRIPSTAAAVTAVDSRVDSVSAVAQSKGVTYTQSTTPPVEARLPQNLWIDTSLGVNLSVTKYWDGNAWTAVSSKEAADAQTAAAADAKAKADAAAAAAISSQAYSNNPSFDDWASTFPAWYSSWNGTPVKETSTVKRAPNAIRFNVPDATSQHGVVFSSIPHAANLEYFTVEVDLYLVSGTLDGSGMILDWNGMTNSRAQIQFKDELPGAATGKWYRVSKVLRRPTNATGTWTSMGGYLMGQWSGHGTGAAKNIIFDWFNVRPSTVEEILAYNAPADATTKANTAQTNATTAAQQNTMLATAYSKNPSFDDWSGSVPDTYTSWGVVTPVKDTTNKRIGTHGMKFTVVGTEDAGIDFTTPLSHMPNLEYVTVELEFMVTSGTLAAAGVLLDWQGLTAPNRAFVRLTDLVPTLTLNKWHRVSAVVKRVGGAGTWSATKGWLMANWGELGAKTAKTIIFDWLNVRPSTAEEILSYKAPTIAYVDQAEADAVSAAALLDAKVNSSRTYINRGESTAGITLINGLAPTVVSSESAVGGKALQKSGTGNGWWADTNGKQPFDPTVLYRIHARIRVTTVATTGGKGFYLGVQGYLADGTTLCNTSGTASTSSQHYLVANSYPVSGQWVDYVGYFKGNAAGNAVAGSSTAIDPYKLHASVRHFEPIVIMDYNAGNGVWELSHLSVEVVDTQAAVDLAAQDTNNKLLTKNRTYFQAAKPSGGTYLQGDVWIDSDDGNKVYVYDTTGGFNDFRLAQDATIDKALYSTFPTDIDTAATNKWLFTRYNKTTSANHIPQYSDVVGFAGTSSLIDDAASMATNIGEQYIGQLRTIVNVVSSKTIALTATHDDGARVYVDGVSVYNKSVYTQNSPISFTLSDGWHVIDFMWAEQAGGDGWSAVSPLLSTQVTSMFAPASLSAVANTANTAVTAANGKNKIVFSTSDASGTSYAAGDTWFKKDATTGNIIKVWEFTTSWQARELNDSVFSSISVGKLVGDWIEAGQIKAGSIDATKLNVSMGGNNLVSNSSFEVDSDSNGLGDDWSAWTRGSGDAGRVFTNTRVAGLFPGSVWAQRVTSTTVTNTNRSSLQNTKLFAIAAGSKVVLSLYGRASVAGDFEISLRCEDDAAVYKGDAMFVASFTTTAQRFSGLVVIPAGTTKAKVTVNTPMSISNGHWFELDGVKAELGDVLSAWSPLTSELLPGTISGNLLTADAINGKVITGATVQTEATASRGIKLTTTEFAGYDGSGIKNFSLTSAGALSLKGDITSGSTITGATVTGSTVQTESTASRGIKLTSTELAGYDTTGVKNFSLTSSGSLTIKGALTTGSTITGSTVTGSTIQTEATIDRGIKLTTTELSGFDTNGIKNFSLTSDGALSLKGAITSGSTITGATITGGLLQTESTAARGIKMDTTELAGYDAAGVKKFSLTSGGSLSLVGAINTGSTITGSTVTGSTIQTEVAASRGIKLTTSELAGYDTTGVKNFSLTSTGALTLKGDITSGSTITGATVTGSTVQTEATASRGIKLTSTELAGFDGTGQKNLSLTSAGALYLRGEIKSGSTIEGAKITGTQGIETSTVANTGVKINNAGIKAYDGTNNLTFILDATTGIVELPGLKANSITGDKLAVDSISAKHLAIGDFTNVAYGGEFNSTQDVANWTLATGITYTTSAPYSGAGCLQSAAGTGVRTAALGRTVAVQPGDKFSIEFYYKTTADANGTASNSKFRIGDQASAHLLSVPYNTVQTAWTKVSTVYEVPATGVSSLTLSLNFDHTVGTVWIDSLVVRKQVSATLIQNGAIKTEHVTLGTLDGGVLSAGSVKALQVGAKAITADKLVITSTDNLVQEGTFNASGVSWELPANFAINATAGRNSTPAMVITNTAALQTSYNAVGNPTKVPIEVQSNGGAAYRVIGWVNSSASVAASGAYISVRFLSSTGSTSVSSVYAPGTLAADTWTEISGLVVAPANTISIAVAINSAAALSTGTLKWDMVSVTRASTGSLIVDGAIDGKTITGATIRTADPALGGARVVMDSTGLKAWDANNKQYLTADGTGLTMVGTVISDGMTEEQTPRPIKSIMGNSLEGFAGLEPVGLHFKRGDRVEPQNFPRIISSKGDALELRSGQDPLGETGPTIESYLNLFYNGAYLLSPLQVQVGTTNTPGNPTGSLRIHNGDGWTAPQFNLKSDNANIDLNTPLSVNVYPGMSGALEVHGDFKVNGIHQLYPVASGAERDSLPRSVEGATVVRTDLGGIKQHYIDGKWTGFSGSVAYVTTQNGYNNYSRGYPTTHAYLGPDGRTYLGGMFGITSTGSVTINGLTSYTMGTLPVGYRPAYPLQLTTASSHDLGACQVSIGTDGAIQYRLAASKTLANGNTQFWISLEGISWRNANC